MTEKRFKNVGKDILQYNEWWCSAGSEHCADVIATAINELLDENEQLKKELDGFKPLIFETDGMPITLYEKKDGGDVE